MSVHRVFRDRPLILDIRSGMLLRLSRMLVRFSSASLLFSIHIAITAGKNCVILSPRYKSTALSIPMHP